MAGSDKPILLGAYNRRIYFFLFTALGILLTIFISACSSSEPVKIGLIAGLTGRVADLGVAGRDGALLAIERQNKQGGIDGRPVELVIRDDRHDKETCRQAVNELIEEEVDAIVGPMTSSMAMVIVPEINRYNIPTIAPTVSTAILAHKDDFFFRVIAVSSLAALHSAEHAYKVKGYRRLFVIYDKSNIAYAEPWFTTLKNQFESYGDGIVEVMGYVSKTGYDFLGLAKEIKRKKMDCLVILANSLDSALLAQQLSKVEMDVPLMASEWSLTDKLIEYGGKTVEGMEVFHSFDPNSNDQAYKEFSVRFQKRFGYEADFASAYAYTATTILLRALKKGRGPHYIKQFILNGSQFDGLQGTIRFDRYGDAIRQYSLLKIRNGTITTFQSN